MDGAPGIEGQEFVAITTIGDLWGTWGLDGLKVVFVGRGCEKSCERKIKNAICIECNFYD